MIKRIILCSNTNAADEDKRVANNTASTFFFFLKALFRPLGASKKHDVYTLIGEYSLCPYSCHLQKMALFGKLS